MAEPLEGWHADQLWRHTVRTLAAEEVPTLVDAVLALIERW